VSAVDTLASGNVGLVGLGLFVAVGSLVPVLPTGALVAATSVVALAADEPVLGLVGVFVAAALGAFVGDAVLLVLGEVVGGPFLHRMAGKADPEKLALAQRELADHELGVLVVSRLLPAGRIPVLVACVLVSFPLRRFAAGNVLAVAVWASCYMVVGTIGAAIFPSLWEGVVAAVALVALVALAPTLWHHARDHHRRSTSGAGRP
jgi:membrane protein DedA with SNARE-associated domain